MRLLVGDDTGLIKVINVEESKLENTFGAQDVNQNVLQMAVINEDYFVTAHKDNYVKLHNYNDTEFRFESVLVSDASTVTMQYSDNKIYATQSDGTISYLDTIIDESNAYLEDAQKLYKAKATLTNKSKLNPYNTGQMAILCKDTNLQLLDIENQKVIWKARNVKNDYLDLAVPICDMDCAFRSETQCFVVNSYRKVRLYDLKENPRPARDYQWEKDKYPFMNCVLSQDRRYLYVSDTAGSVFVLDTRKEFKMVGKLKGTLGSVTAMAISQANPYLITVSLDRYARVYNTNTNQLFRKIYLKNKLNAVAIYDDQIDVEKINEYEENLKNEAGLKKTQTQNQIKEDAVTLKKKARKSKLKLTFEKKKAPKPVQEEEEEEENNNEVVDELDYD
jgi:ribosome biogenesis protein NSA1